MTTSDTNNTRPGGSWIKILLFGFAMLLLSAASAQAQSTVNCVADSGGVIDGFVNPVPPSQINIDGNCTIRNYPGGMSTNFSFQNIPGHTDERWLVIFDNVVHTGGIGKDGTASPKDPTRPGVFLYVMETPEATLIDVWENVPRAP